MKVKSKFIKGIIDGIPIALGYISVSFGFGITAVRLGISALAAIGISASNLTSAGQVAGIGIIAAGGTLFEMALTQFIINIRYSLMGIALTQKMDEKFTLPHRLICAFGVTDEVFAVAASKKENITPEYMYGLILLPIIGWTAGTAMGSLASQLLPSTISNAMGIVIYAMFIAIVLPQAKRNFKILAVALGSIALSSVFKYLVPSISSGFSIIITAVVISAVAALIFPETEEEE